MGKGRSDAGASFVLQHFPFTELLCLCLPISSMLRGCNKTYLLPGVPGFDLRAHTPQGEKPCKVLRYSRALRVSTVWELINYLERNSEKLPKNLRMMVVGSCFALGPYMGRVLEVELLSFGVSGVKVCGLALPTGVFKQNGVLSWESLGFS